MDAYLRFFFSNSFLAPSPLIAQQLVRNVTPAEWRANDVQWNRDVNPHNQIDDLIDASDSGEFAVIVNFSRCVANSDIEMLNALTAQSEVLMRLRYITSVAVRGLTKADIENLVNMPDIAFVERMVGFGPLLEITVPTLCVTPGDCQSSVAGSYPDLDGSGVNIAIMDSGVDNTHDAFATTPFVAGYDALTQTMGDPDDDWHHGTLIASIALGQTTVDASGNLVVSRGVAPGAGLIDVKVFDGSTVCTDESWLNFVDALQVLYDNRNSWDVDIINMSFGQCSQTGPAYSNGLDAFSQLVDLAESMGIVVVAAMGNDGPANTGIPTPAAATRAITVAASVDNSTVSRTDDEIRERSSRGPRPNDGDSDDIDELKPEVTAPGARSNPFIASNCDGINAPAGIRGARFNTTNGTLTACGTSLAAPHVSGIAALIIEARPNISPGSVKDLVIRTASARGQPSSSADPTWNNRWGWGLVDAFAAVDLATVTDLTYPSHPPDPAWASPDITMNPFPPQRGQPTTVTVQVKNAGQANAMRARVNFGVNVFSAATPTFYDIGTKIIDVPPNSSVPVSIQWTPAAESHQCVKVEIGYGPDMDYTNNVAQRNVTVQSSPATFQVKNTHSVQPEIIQLVPTLEVPTQGWQVILNPNQVTLGAENCPVNVDVELIPPPGTPTGTVGTVHVAAQVQTFTGPLTLGGVSVQEIVDDPVIVVTTPWVPVVTIALVMVAVVLVLVIGFRFMRRS